MPKRSFFIEGTSQSFTVEAADISSLGGSASPFLQIPLTIELFPIENKSTREIAGITNFVLTNIEASVSFEGFQHWTSQSRITINRDVTHKTSFSCILSFPFDQYKISVIEKNRTNNIPVRLYLTFYFSIFAKPPFFTNVPAESRGYVTKYGDVVEEVNIEIPQSHWVSKILLGFGYKAFKLIEIPEYSTLIPSAFKLSKSELSEANKYFLNNDFDKCVAHCRGAINPFTDKVKIAQLKAAIASSSEFEWLNKINNATADWLGVLLKETWQFTSKPHHPPSMGHFSRSDAEIIYLITIAIVAYIGKIDSEKNV